MKKKLSLYITGILVLGICSYFIIFNYKNYRKIELVNVKVDNYDDINKTVSVLLERKINTFNNEFYCHADGNKNKYKIKGENNKCLVVLDLNDTYILYLTNDKEDKSNIINLNDIFNGVLSFKFLNETIYMIPEEEKEITYFEVLLDKKVDYNFKSSNTDIIEIKDNKIIAKNVGNAYIYSDKVKDKLNVEVTNLVTKPYAIKDKKKLLPCNAYSKEDANILDKILEYKINEAGYQTRGGAVAAARFLTLEFNYRIPYFYENGRVPLSETNKTNINTHITDGEGRYYKKGLYLSDSKKESIIVSWKGPSIWGCGLTNLEDEPRFGYIVGKKMPNGLDCSGFVTWSLKNAGFDPGDVGAGESPNIDNQCTDLGEFRYLATEIDNVKVGDLLNWWGHIAMLIGIDGDTYYVAESLSYIGGVRAMIYTKKELLNTFEYVVLMDKFYKKDGNYQNFW